MTLEELMRGRHSDHRAMNAVLDINADRVFIDFGNIGPIPAVRLHVKGNAVNVVDPKVSRDASGHEGGEVIEAAIDGEKITAGKDGPTISLPEGYALVTEAELEAVMNGQSSAEGGEGVDGGDGSDGSGGSGGEPDTPASEPENSSDSNPEPIDPENHSKDELIEIGKATEGAEFSTSDTKAEIAAAIDKARGL